MLYDFFCDLSSVWMAHTQYIEGVNGTIKKQKKVAPHMSLRLMSARTLIRRQFPVPSRRAKIPNRGSNCEEKRKQKACQDLSPAAY
jgi:hypothetical protein